MISLSGIRNHRRAAIIALATTLALLLWAGRSWAASPLEVGYMPILADSQAFVVLNQQVRHDPLAHAKLIEFQDGPAIVQALLAGQLDLAYVGIGPAMVARAKGADIRIVATDELGSTSLLALGDLAPYFDGNDAAIAIKKFTHDKGHAPLISVFPRGSVPDSVLQYWLRHVAHVGPGSIRIIYQGAAQLQQSLLTGAVDGAATLEPITTMVLAKRADAKVVVPSTDMYPHQPGAALVVRESLIQQRPKFVQKLVAAHVAATELLHDHPAQVAPAVQKYVGGGRLPLKVVLTSMKNLDYTANPNSMIASTEKLYKFQKAIGALPGTLNVKQFFDTQFYDNLK